MSSSLRIGVDAGGTKTECILIDASGGMVAHHLAPGCNPSVVGPEQARGILFGALDALLANAGIPNPRARVTHTHIYAAGSRAFWRETAATMTGFGEVFTADDSHPVLELATHGKPGLVLHGGTGSFVAARGRDGRIHYAGGIGWRFGDPGSGYDLGRRAIAHGLLELQGWASASSLGNLLRRHTGLGESADTAALTRHFYTHPDPNGHIGALAPALLQLASEGDPVAHGIIASSCHELLGLALDVVAKLFTPDEFPGLQAGLSGPILTHPVVVPMLSSRTPFPLAPVEGRPIEGVRRLLMRAWPWCSRAH